MSLSSLKLFPELQIHEYCPSWHHGPQVPLASIFFFPPSWLFLQKHWASLASLTSYPYLLSIHSPHQQRGLSKIPFSEVFLPMNGPFQQLPLLWMKGKHHEVLGGHVWHALKAFLFLQLVGCGLLPLMSNSLRHAQLLGSQSVHVFP